MGEVKEKISPATLNTISEINILIKIKEKNLYTVKGKRWII